MLSIFEGFDSNQLRFAAAAALAGLLIVLLGWFRDRSRGRPRCPKCWFSLRSTHPTRAQPIVCPECGHSIARRRRLFRTRRNRRLVALGLLVIAAATTIPKWLRDGPHSLIPIAAAVPFAPGAAGEWLDEQLFHLPSDHWLIDEVKRRTDEHQMTDLAWRAWVWRLRKDLDAEGRLGIDTGQRELHAALASARDDLPFVDHSITNILGATGVSLHDGAEEFMRERSNHWGREATVEQCYGITTPMPFLLDRRDGNAMAMVMTSEGTVGLRSQYEVSSPNLPWNPTIVIHDLEPILNEMRRWGFDRTAHSREDWREIRDVYTRNRRGIQGQEDCRLLELITSATAGFPGVETVMLLDRQWLIVSAEGQSQIAIERDLLRLADILAIRHGEQMECSPGRMHVKAFEFADAAIANQVPRVIEDLADAWEHRAERYYCIDVGRAVFMIGTARGIAPREIWVQPILHALNNEWDRVEPYGPVQDFKIAADDRSERSGLYDGSVFMELSETESGDEWREWLLGDLIEACADGLVHRSHLRLTLIRHVIGLRIESEGHFVLLHLLDRMQKVAEGDFTLEVDRLDVARRSDDDHIRMLMFHELAAPNDGDASRAASRVQILVREFTMELHWPPMDLASSEPSFELGDFFNEIPVDGAFPDNRESKPPNPKCWHLKHTLAVSATPAVHDAIRQRLSAMRAESPPP